MGQGEDSRKEDDRKRKTEAKGSFLKHYYPDTQSSPGGSIKLVRHSTLNSILITDSNGDRVTVEGDRNIIQETSSQHFSMQSLPLSKRTTENIHTEETFSSPSKRLKLSNYTQKQAGAELCQAQFMLGLVKPAAPFWPARLW